MIDFIAMLKKKYPDADFDRYRYVTGDMIELPDGAVVLCIHSAIYHIEACVVKRSFKYNEYKQYRIPYEEIPAVYGEFIPAGYKIRKSLNWRVGDIVDDNGYIVYLYQEVGHQQFYGWVIKAVNEYYLHTGIYLVNPYADYIVAK